MENGENEPSFKWSYVIRKEKVVLIVLATFLVLLLTHNFLLAKPVPIIITLSVFLWLSFIIFITSFAIVRHASALASSLQEPFGTLILTLSVVILEVALITSIMLTGENTPSLARDTMFAIIMIVLNGLVGLTLMVGSLRYGEQHINLQGAKSFLSVILLVSVVGLILPSYTRSPGATLSPFLTVFLICTSLIIYAIFLGIQTVRHRKYFLEIAPDKKPKSHRHGAVHYPIWAHVALLILYLIGTIFSAKVIALPVDYALAKLKAPPALGGVLVALLVLAPEAMTAIQASLHNLIQHSVNILLGSVLATIGLTIPAVLTVGMITGKTVELGLDPVDCVLLSLTLLMSVLTIAGGRTNVLQGAIHILLFLAYFMLIFD